MAVISNGTTIIDAGALGGSVAKGAMTLLSTQTASSSATISFTSGIDSTYDSYVFKFINIHPQTDNVQFHFNVSIDSGSNYNVAKSTTFFEAAHNEGDSDAFLDYASGRDLAQGTGFQNISQSVGNDNDQTLAGYLHIFNPSDTTFVKHFIARTNTYYYGDITIDLYSSGYFNETDAIDEFQFKFSTGNIDAGDICLYGIA